MRFLFKSETRATVPGGSYSSVVMELDAELREDVIEEFERFLLASGFVFDGHLEIVED